MRKVALVTGGAVRLGAAIVRRLSAEGWQVVIHCNASRHAAEALAAELRAAGRDAAVVQADLADRGAVHGLVAAASQPFGPPPGLGHNAALFRRAEIATLTWEAGAAHASTNCAAPVFLAKRFAAALPPEEAGCIVNILDQKIANLNPDFLSYTASKLGLAGITPVLAMALAPRIRVNGVAPGLTLISGKQTQESFERAWRDTILGRGSTPEDIAAAVAFILASPAMQGQTLFVDGGESLGKRARDVAFDPKLAPPQ